MPHEIGKNSHLSTGVVDPIGFNADRDPAYYLNADPDPGRQTNADPFGSRF